MPLDPEGPAVSGSNFKKLVAPALLIPTLATPARVGSLSYHGLSKRTGKGGPAPQNSFAGRQSVLNLLRDCQKLLFLFGFRRLVERTGLLPQGVHQCIENGLQGLRAIAKYAFHALANDGELADLTHASHIEITACAPWLP